MTMLLHRKESCKNQNSINTVCDAEKSMETFDKFMEVFITIAFICDKKYLVDFFYIF